ncbi:MAG: CRISPR-associated endoribonuclease Cas6 [Fusobacterium sp.]
MRLYIKTSASKEIVPFNHLHLLSGTLHKWFGSNNFHDKISLYSFSMLRGGDFSNLGLKFNNGATFFISCWEVDKAKLLIQGIQSSPDLFCGMKVIEITLKQNPDLYDTSYFQLGSPIFIQRTIDGNKKRFFYYSDKESSNLLKETLQNKMKKAGLQVDDTLEIHFDKSYRNKHTKKIDYKKGKRIIQIKANCCPVIIEGKMETKQFAWCVGLGNSTGIGFGAIK